MMEKQDSDLLQTSLQVLVLASILVIFTIALKYLVWRQQYSKLVPCYKPRFFNLLGNFSEVPIMKKSKNGLPVNFYAMQLIEALSNLFPKEQLCILWAGCHPIILLKRAEALEAALKGTKFLSKNFFYSFLNAMLGNGLITSDVPKWKNRRKLLNPPFLHEYLKDFLPEMNECAQFLVQKLEGETSKESSDIHRLIALCVLDILGNSIMGVKFEAQTTNADEYSSLVHMMHRENKLLGDRVMSCFDWPDFIYSLTKNGKTVKKDVADGREKFKMIIEGKKEQYFKGKSNLDAGRKMSVMDILLKHFYETKKIDEEGIMEEAITITFAGVDTTSNNITVALYFIGLYPNVQAKIQEELQFIFGEDNDRYAKEEDLKDMKYLECVIKESLRIHPPITFIFREATEDSIIGGYPVPKGSSLAIAPWILHRDKEVFPEPEKFDPDRFLPEMCSNRHPFAYAPFSAGPRNCIGKAYALMKEKVILSTLLRHYSVQSLDQRDKLVTGLGLVIQFSKEIRLKIRHKHLRTH